MSTSTNKHRYKNKLLGLLSNFILKIVLYFICIVSLMTDASIHLS